MQLLYEAAQCAEDLQKDPEKTYVWQMLTEQAARLIEKLSDRVSIS